MLFSRLCVVAGLVMAAAAASAAGPQAQQYCNEMYPAESYAPEERTLYVQECLEMYGDEIEAEAAVGTDPEPSPDVEMAPEVEPSDSYYDGTVEEFVESLPAEEGAGFQ